MNILKLKNNIQHAIADNICNWCHIDIKHFDSQLSAEEYQISALCQDCQNAVFGGDYA